MDSSIVKTASRVLLVELKGRIRTSARNDAYGPGMLRLLDE
jgi:hypothetical protein